jgi:hypothetical protein
MTAALVLILVRLSLRRRRQSHSIAANLSDIFLVCSWLTAIVDISINAWKNTLRMRYLSWPSSELYYMVPHDQSAHLLKVSWISLYFIYISLWFAKAAFIAFYYDIFYTHGSWRMKWVLHSAGAFAAATFILQMGLLTFWCNPISGNWNVDGELCSAVHSITSVTISTFANIGTDLLIVSIPLSAIAGANLRKVEILGIVFVLLMGSASIIAAVARFIILKIVEHVPRASITHTIDVCATIEIFTSLCAVCLPSLRAFVRTRRPDSSKTGSHLRSASKSSPLLKDSSPLGGHVSASPPSRPSASNSEKSFNSLQLPEKMYSPQAAHFV